MVDINKNISNLTGIPVKYLTKINIAAIYSINDAIENAEHNGDNVTVLDIGIGSLSIKIENNTILYKFIPNKQLETSIRNTIINKQNIIDNKLELNLVEKITKFYKELI